MNIIRRTQGGPVQPAVPEWEPLRVMREWLRWDPFRELAPSYPGDERATTFCPTFEVKETHDAYRFTADVPGLAEKDLEVSLVGTRLTISGRREAEQHEQSDAFFLNERSYGAFTRTFTLPQGVDTEHVRAELAGGVLTLTLPKLPEVKARTIAVERGDKAKH